MGDPINCYYQLRRIGPPKSLEGVKDVLRLQIGCNKFGRSYLKGGENEFYLDSCKMKYFISRQHAEIYVRGDGSCLLVDLGLNGTYVNDIRVDGNCPLHIDDRVTFGHANGMKFKPGDYAPQSNSEFQFVFEKADDWNLQSVKQESEKKESLCEIELKFDSLSENEGDRHSRFECNLREKDFSDGERQGSEDRNVPLSHPCNVPVSGKPEHTVSAAVLLQTQLEEGVNRTILLTPRKPPSPAPPKNNAVIVLEISDESNSDIESPSNNQTAVLGSSRNQNSDNGQKPCDTKDDDAAFVVLNSSSDLSKCEKQVSRTESSSIGNSNHLSGQDEVECPGSPVIPNMSHQSHTPIHGESQSVFGRKIELTFSKNASPVHIQSAADDAGIVSSSESEDGSVHSTSVSQIGTKRQKRTLKNRGKRKKKSKMNRGDTVQWYEIATCASLDCKKPNSQKIGWVQCDNCDQWYHTSCVGCNYTQVKDKDIEFYCGCV